MRANVATSSITVSDQPQARWSAISAALGALSWLAVLGLPGAGVTSGSVEHGFLFMPLVAFPLALMLQRRLLAEVAGPRAERAQPIAAALLLASFWLPKGPVAGTLSLGWLAVALHVTATGLPAVLKRREGFLANLNLIAAHVFLPIGAVWVVLSRLGVAPRNFGSTTALLAALHFHFSGFTLQLLIAATGRALSCPRLLALQRVLSLCAVAGIPLIALGKLSSLGSVKLIGVALVVIATVLHGITQAALARRTTRPAARALLCVAAISVVGAMTLAAIYGIGEATGAVWIGIPRMALLHGLLNALGFTLCGLLAHLALLRAAPQ